MSVGEWLNNVIQQGDDDDGEPMRAVDYDDEDDDGWREEARRDYRREPRRGPPRRPRRREAEIDHEAALAHEEFGEVHARLDRLTQQLERMARSSASRLTGAPTPPQRRRSPPLPRPRNGDRPAPPEVPVSVDDAVAEIAERQRVLYGSNVPIAPVAPLPEPEREPEPSVPEPREAGVDISNLEEQLRYITTRIESLRPTHELEKVIKSFRKDLTEISQQLTEALPRHAIESLESEVQALAQRLDYSRESGVDLGLLAGLEHGLAEVRDALRGLTPAESLVGFDDAVRTLAQKVDLIIAREDPAALQQLETAIGALRGIVSHVASNDTLTKVAEDVRALAAKVDDVANSAASGQAVSALESRIDSLANAIGASADAGHAVPRELEKLLSGLIEKLEWVQLTQTDHAALGSLEDRIAQLIKRLDASDARLGNLEAVERGIADLLVHIDQIRGGNGAAPAAAVRKPVAVEAIVRDVAEIRRSERRTQDSLEAVHGAVEHVVDRLAMIESGMHDGAVKAEAPSELQAAEPAPEAVAAAEFLREGAPEPMPLAAVALPTAAPEPAAAQLPARPAGAPTGAPRAPIDPNLPPDHPLEPGSAAGPRAMPSAAERIAASEAAVGFAKPPVIAEPADKPNFIAAARRAAQAAAAAAPERQTRSESVAAPAERPSRLRKLLVAGVAVLVAAGGLHLALHLFQGRAAKDDGSAGAPPASLQPSAPPKVIPESDSPKDVPPTGPLVLPVPGASSATAPSAPPAPSLDAPPSVTPDAPPSTKPVTVPPANPQRQSSLSYSPEITGALPRRVPPPPQPQQLPPASIAAVQPPAAAAPAMVTEKLPATIGGPKLRAAAIAGNAAAEFEVATRFAEGHGVPPSEEQAVRWLELAAKQGLAPAQFRLGGFYEKGIAVKKDLALARDFYAAAAAKGNGKAMHNLAVLYAEGINGPADYRTAAQWFHRAAVYGVSDSQYNLAILYARGIGVEQNYAESYKWFALAADNGDSEAAKKRDEIATHLDAQSLAAAKLAVEKWTAEPQPEDAVTAKAPPGGWDQPAHDANPPPRVMGGKSAPPAFKLN
jgi:localization factor PodJL